MSAGPCVVGLDLGTSALKAVAVDGDGRVVATARAAYPTARPEPGASEQDPGDWTAAAAHAVGRLQDALGGVPVEAVGLSGMLPTLVVLDRVGDPVGPAVTWEDGRADAQGRALAEAVGVAALYAATGQRVDGRYLLPMYLRRAGADPGRAGTAVVGAKDHLFGWLTGQWATDPSTAAGYGCYDLASGRWSAPVLDAVAALLPAGTRLPALPPVRPAADVAPLRPAAAARLGLPAGTPVTVGAADSVLGALGLGVVEPGQVAYLAGTSTVILGVAAEPVLDPGMRYLVTPLAGPDGWGLEMDLLTTGSALAWLADLTGVAVADLVALAATRDPRTAPVVLPHLAPGEQGALWCPELAGSVLGLTLAHDRGDLARGLLNGIVVETRRCLEVLAQATGRRGPVHVGGGGSAGGVLAELAAATRRPARSGPAATADHSALGAAWLAAGRTSGRPAGATPPGPQHTAVGDPAVGDPAVWDPAVWDEVAARHDAALHAVAAYHGRHPDTRTDT